MAWTAWTAPGTALVDGVPLRGLAVERDDAGNGGRVRVRLSEDLGLADPDTDERELLPPASREVEIPLADFLADPGHDVH